MCPDEKFITPPRIIPLYANFTHAKCIAEDIVKCEC
jgi:hypothetical protein